MKDSKFYKRRGGKSRQQLSWRKTVLIVCEGEKTEPRYFDLFRKELRLSTIEIEIAGKECGSAPICVVDKAIQMKKDRKNSVIRSSYDSIWCVIDVETKSHESLDRAINKANGNKLHIALSNPAFEYWFLLHFEKTAALFQNYSQLEKALKDHYPNYDKADPNIFSAIYPSTSRAIKNAKEIQNEMMWGINLKRHNPSTHVYKVVEELQEIATMPLPYTK